MGQTNPNQEAHFSITDVLTQFFKLKDWKKRSLFIGLPFSASFVTFCIFTVLFLAIFFKADTSTIVFSLLSLLLVMVSGVVLVITGLSLSGYRIKQSEAERDSTEIHNLYTLNSFLSRIKHALILSIYSLVYQIIPLGVYIFAIMLKILTAIGSFDSLFFSLGSLITTVSTILQIIVEFVFYPVVFARYINDPSPMSVINYASTWNSYKKQPKMVTTIGMFRYVLKYTVFPVVCVGMIGLLFAGSISLGVYPFFAGVTFVIFVPIIAVFSTYVQHSEGLLIGKLAKVIRYNHE